MANTKTSIQGVEQVKVDTAPGTGGYWTDPITLRKGNDTTLEKVFFSVRESEASPESASVVIPTLQFRGYGDLGWTDYYNDGNDFAVGDCKILEGAGLYIQFRAGVKEGDYTSGSVNIGFAF